MVNPMNPNQAKFPTFFDNNAAQNSLNAFKDRLNQRRAALEPQDTKKPAVKDDSVELDAAKQQKPAYDLSKLLAQRFPNAVAAPEVKTLDDLDALLTNRFGNFLTKSGMEAMGFDIGSLLGGIDLSSYSAISAQFELNLSVSQMIQTANGVQMSQFDFSLKLDFQYFSASNGGKNPFATGASSNPNDIWAKLKDYFSPQNTANRILDFATSFFGKSQAFKEGGNTEEARGKFAELMRDAIGKGFSQAQAILGKLPENIQKDIDDTKTYVDKGIEDFIKNGRNNLNQAALQAWQFELSMSYSYTETTTTYTYVPDTAAAAAGVNATDPTAT